LALYAPIPKCNAHTARLRRFVRPSIPDNEKRRASVPIRAKSVMVVATPRAASHLGECARASEAMGCGAAAPITRCITS
jgi:hypothetical protein